VDDCKLIIQDYVDEAMDSLKVLPDSKYRDSLMEMTRLNLTRLN